MEKYNSKKSIKFSKIDRVSNMTLKDWDELMYAVIDDVLVDKAEATQIFKQLRIAEKYSDEKEQVLNDLNNTYDVYSISDRHNKNYGKFQIVKKEKELEL